MLVDTQQLIEAAARLERLAALIEAGAGSTDHRVRRTAGMLDGRPAEALDGAWRGVRDGLSVLAAGYRTYARGFAELAARYEELDDNLLPRGRIDPGRGAR